jgi:multicomponent Na+:H+ antiporter subunit G
VIINFLSAFFIVVGLFFWFWGTKSLLKPRSLLLQLHYLSISDTLGSLSIVFGLLLLRPKEWPLLLLALISIALWNTLLSYVLAYCSNPPPLDNHADL